VEQAGRQPARYLDSDGLLKYFPIMEQGSDSLTAYVLSATKEAGYAIPEQTKNRMEAALTAFVQGKIVRRARWPRPTWRAQAGGAGSAVAFARYRPMRWRASASAEPVADVRRHRLEPVAATHAQPGAPRCLLAEAQQICVRA
jgi:hypothetical protein